MRKDLIKLLVTTWERILRSNRILIHLCRYVNCDISMGIQNYFPWCQECQEWKKLSLFIKKPLISKVIAKKLTVNK